MNVKDLDLVLNSLNNTDKLTSETFNGIVNIVGKDTFTEKEIHLILLKLVKDGYVLQKFAEKKLSNGEFVKSDVQLFHITYDGHVFLKNGGYSNPKKKNWIQKYYKEAFIYPTIAFIFTMLGIYWSNQIDKEQRQKLREETFQYIIKQIKSRQN